MPLLFLRVVFAFQSRLLLRRFCLLCASACRLIKRRSPRPRHKLAPHRPRPTPATQSRPPRLHRPRHHRRHRSLHSSRAGSWVDRGRRPARPSRYKLACGAFHYRFQLKKKNSKRERFSFTFSCISLVVTFYFTRRFLQSGGGA